ncbi:hypothetical protein WM11_12965 [Burkholderia ubonensis]|uniref:DUF3644 domain-containing protein n=1 Tax=Burkholderia ubonensis TaxID=101571 RepID=UPI00075C62C5|nr:DUF3644 domain-containing protein [Burkholderia ubonensis]KWK05162.1 hypothetical protein WM11_12965 [Burkholderia ubonensis]
MKLVDDLFEMNGGYVLDFSDRTMGIFFLEELNIDIDDPAYLDNGTSKAKRLRCFLNKVDLATAITTLKALWKHRESVRQSQGRDDWVINAEGQFLSLINRLEGKPEGTAGANRPPTGARWPPDSGTQDQASRVVSTASASARLRF